MPAPRRLRTPVPTVVVLGAAGAGKSALLGRVLAAKPPGEVWALLSNGSGAPAVAGGGEPAAADAPVLPSGGVVTRALGSCVCCTVPGITEAAIAQLVRAARPDRLLMEPSGLARPERLLQLLRTGHMATSLDVQRVVAVFDLTTFLSSSEEEEGRGEAPPREELARAADAVVGTKADTAPEGAAAAFERWAAAAAPAARRAVASRGVVAAPRDVFGFGGGPQGADDGG